MKSVRGTARRDAIRDYMIAFTAERGCPPTVREVAAGIGGASTSSIHGHFRALAAEGFLHRPGSHRQATPTNRLTADGIELAYCLSTHGLRPPKVRPCKRHRIMAEWLAVIVLPRALALP